MGATVASRLAMSNRAVLPALAQQPTMEGPSLFRMVLRTPRYVVTTLKSVYGNEHGVLLAAGAFIFIVGMATMMDVLRGARRA